MKDYIEIKTQEDMEALLNRIAGFHDGMAKELHLLNRGCVDPDHSMVMTHSFDARLLIQTQWRPYAIELLFIGIERIETTDPGEFWGATGEVTHKEIPIASHRVSVSFDSHFNISAQRLFVLDRPDWLGPRSRLGSEVPNPECVPATPLEGGWRQCSTCADAFQVPPDVTYVLCPNCGILTELE